jgi:hypothetical protein
VNCARRNRIETLTTHQHPSDRSALGYPERGAAVWESRHSSGDMALRKAGIEACERRIAAEKGERDVNGRRDR